MSVSRARREDFSHAGETPRYSISKIPEEILRKLVPQIRTVKDVNRAFNELYRTRSRSFTIDIQYLLYGIQPFDNEIQIEDYKNKYSLAVRERVGKFFYFSGTIKLLELRTYCGYTSAINDILGVINAKKLNILRLKFTDIMLFLNAPLQLFSFFEKLEELDVSLSPLFPAVYIIQILPFCKNLKKLNMSNYKKWTDNFDSFANSLSQCKSLQSISMENCELDENKLSTLFRIGLNQLQNIQEINLNNNELEFSELSELSIHPLAGSLKSIFMKNVFGEFPPQFTKILLTILDKTNSLIKIDLSNNFIGKENSLTLVALLEKNRNIEELNLSHCGLCIDDLADVIGECTKLEALDLSENFFHHDEKITQILQETRSIRTFNLRESHKKGEQYHQLQGFDESIIFETLCLNQTITALCTSATGINSNHALKKMLEENQTIRFLSLDADASFNVSNFCQQLGHNSTLTALHISKPVYCKMQNLDGLNAMLSANKSLTSLSLESLNMNISDIMPSLQKNTTIRELNVSRNTVENSEKLREFLENNNTITSIDISLLTFPNKNKYDMNFYNNICSKKFLDILKGLQKNTTIRSISLVPRYVDANNNEKLKEIADILLQNKSICAFQLFNQHDENQKFLKTYFKNHHPRIRAIESLNIATIPYVASF